MSTSENPALPHHWIHELTWPAFQEWMKSDPAPVVIIGLGSVEQHGPHLPLGTDSLVAREFVHEVAVRSNSVCVHPCFPGYSPHHMEFPGTIAFKEGTLRAVLMDTIGSLSHHGIKRFVMMTGHGRNSPVMNLVIQSARFEFKVMVAVPDGPGDTKLAKLQADRTRKHWDVHAGITETGEALHLFPDLVEMRLLDGWKPTLRLSPAIKDFLDPDRSDYGLVRQVFSACSEPCTHQFTSSGVYGDVDPREGSAEEARGRFEEKVNYMVEFIRVWKTIPLPPGFQG